MSAHCRAYQAYCSTGDGMVLANAPRGIARGISLAQTPLCCGAIMVYLCHFASWRQRVR